MYVRAQVCLSDSLKPEYGLPRQSTYNNSNAPLSWSHMENAAQPAFLLPELFRHKCFATITAPGSSLDLAFMLAFAARAAAAATVGDPAQGAGAWVCSGRGREWRCSCRNPCRGFQQHEPGLETELLLGLAES